MWFLTLSLFFLPIERGFFFPVNLFVYLFWISADSWTLGLINRICLYHLTNTNWFKLAPISLWDDSTILWVRTCWHSLMSQAHLVPSLPRLQGPISKALWFPWWRKAFRKQDLGVGVLMGTGVSVPLRRQVWAWYACTCTCTCAYTRARTHFCPVPSVKPEVHTGFWFAASTALAI